MRSSVSMDKGGDRGDHFKLKSKDTELYTEKVESFLNCSIYLKEGSQICVT